MHIILLAGGVSRRMQPLPNKNTLNIAGKDLLDYNIHEIQSLENVESINIIFQESQRAYFENRFGADQKINLFPQAAANGMAGAILSLQNLPNALVISANDMLEPQFLAQLIATIQDQKPKAAILGKQVDSYFHGGYLSVDANNHLTDIVEKPPVGQEPSDLVNLVYHYFEDLGAFQKILKNLGPLEDDSYEQALRALSKQIPVLVIPYKGQWQAVKKPWNLLDMQKHLIAKGYVKSRSNVQIHPTAIVEDSVTFGDNVVIDAYAIIKGQTFIGDNSYVGSYSMIRDSHIGANCLVGSRCEITRSYLGDDNKLHANFVGDSYIGNHCLLGYGVTTANYRLDGKTIDGQPKLGAILGNNVQIGCHTVLCPGVKIGANSVLGPNIVLKQDLTANSYLKVNTSQEIRENRN